MTWPCVKGRIARDMAVCAGADPGINQPIVLTSKLPRNVFVISGIYLDDL